MILKRKKRKKEAVRGGVVFLMAACICLGQAAPVLALDAAWSQKVEITAHRGDSIKALENTIPAFEKAIESGADWIELDVKETRDNVPVVFHDSSGTGWNNPGNDSGRDQKTSSCRQYGTRI